jgi:GR25 family glycosyltransferase involved in LPS biosynthesis
MIIHIIHVERHESRKEQFLINNATLKNFSWYRAIEGSNINFTNLLEEGIISPKFEMIPNSLGLTLTVIELLKKCVEINEPITIMEDDAIAIPNFEKTSETLLESIGGNFDVIFWGWNFDALMWLLPFGEKHPIKIVSDRIQEKKLLPDFTENFQDVTHQLVPLGHQWGTMCWSVSPEGASKILDKILPIDTEPYEKSHLGLWVKPIAVDELIGKLIPGLLAYTCFPPLCFAINDKTESTIWTEKQDETWLKKIFNKLQNIINNFLFSNRK